MQSTPNVLTRVEGVIGMITLNRPDRHNAFDDGLIAELTAALATMQADQAVRVVMLRAAGPSFCAGADLNWMRRMADYGPAQNHADAMRLAELLALLDGMPKPTVARVQGNAYGGGVGLVACCDIAVATEPCLFSFSEARLGLIPATISPYVVNAIGARHARRLFLTAERFGAAEAHRIGLVHEVVPAAALDQRVQAIIGDLLTGGPSAQAACKALVARVVGQSIDQTLMRDTAQRIADARASDEGRAGVRAFLDKRRADWVTTISQPKQD